MKNVNQRVIFMLKHVILYETVALNCWKLSKTTLFSVRVRIRFLVPKTCFWLFLVFSATCTSHESRTWA